MKLRLLAKEEEGEAGDIIDVESARGMNLIAGGVAEAIEEGDLPYEATILDEPAAEEQEAAEGEVEAEASSEEEEAK